MACGMLSACSNELFFKKTEKIRFKKITIYVTKKQQPKKNKKKNTIISCAVTVRKGGFKLIIAHFFRTKSIKVPIISSMYFTIQKFLL